MNSINWARVMAQIVYYFTAAISLGAPDRKLAFAVPTGNFGNVYAAHAARKMGLSIEKLIVGSNANDILTRYFDSGEMKTSTVIPTLSPSMDIQISSNFERLLFDQYRGDGAAVTKVMERFRRRGAIKFGKTRWNSMRRQFEGHRVGDNATMETIASVYAESRTLLDPHTAIGVAAGRAASPDPGTVLVCMATAHPAKISGRRRRIDGEFDRIYRRALQIFMSGRSITPSSPMIRKNFDDLSATVWRSARPHDRRCHLLSEWAPRRYRFDVDGRNGPHSVSGSRSARETKNRPLTAYRTF